MEGEREGGTFIGCSVSSVFCSLPPYLPSRLLPVFPDGARVNTSGGRPSVKSVSQREKKGGKEGSLIVFCLCSLLILCLSPTYFILTLSLYQ